MIRCVLIINIIKYFWYWFTNRHSNFRSNHFIELVLPESSIQFGGKRQLARTIAAMEETTRFQVLESSSGGAILDSEVRKPSNVRGLLLVVLVLLVLLLTLSIVFIVLYAQETNDDSRPTQARATATAKKACSSPDCVISSSGKYEIQYERSICMGFTRRAVVNHIQIGREYCILLKIRMHVNNYVNQLFWWNGLF